MTTLSAWRPLGVMAIIALITGLTGPWSNGKPAQAHQAGVGCAALGRYHVGRTIPPPIQPSPQGTGSPTSSTAIAQPYLGGVLTGTITLSSYTACGAATTGSFSVALSAARIPLPMASSGHVGSTGETRTSTAAIIYPGFVGTTVLTATGTFSQDPTHPRDPLYLSVDASVTYGRFTLGCPPICGAQRAPGAPMCVPVGCRPGETVSRVSDFTGVTGYLRVQAASAGLPATVALSFLPPPDAKATSIDAAMSALQPVTLVGIRTD
ncbi:MAG TPA: hypothetical protein VN837_09430 [Chloroflexota bacterium]|nr:hypothetical protein [Chloroflexota bacterium]